MCHSLEIAMSSGKEKKRQERRGKQRKAMKSRLVGRFFREVTEMSEGDLGGFVLKKKKARICLWQIAPCAGVFAKGE